jgi:hypothetical protein
MNPDLARHVSRRAGLKEILIEPSPSGRPSWRRSPSCSGNHPAALLRTGCLLRHPPAAGAKGLGQVSDWLITHTRALEIPARLVIGLPFLAKGLAAL